MFLLWKLMSAQFTPVGCELALVEPRSSLVKSSVETFTICMCVTTKEEQTVRLLQGESWSLPSSQTATQGLPHRYSGASGQAPPQAPSNIPTSLPSILRLQIPEQHEQVMSRALGRLSGGIRQTTLRSRKTGWEAAEA